MELSLTKLDYRMLRTEAATRKMRYRQQGRFAEAMKMQDVQVILIKESELCQQ